MISFIDYGRVARLRNVSRYVSLLGLALLFGGMLILFVIDDPSVLLYQLAAMIGGWMLSQVGIYLAHRYVRDPRPDEVLDQALKKVVRDGRLYHYILPAAHVLLTPAGPIIFVLKYQVGRISVENDRWQQGGVGLSRFFGQQALGNPTREAEIEVKKLANFIRKHAPSVEEVPIGALIVFTTKGLKSLELGGSSIPAMHYTKLRGYLSRQGLGTPLAADDYAALRSAFDAAAGDLVDA